VSVIEVFQVGNWSGLVRDGWVDCIVKYGVSIHGLLQCCIGKCLDLLELN
jgi:hypothetical protein